MSQGGTYDLHEPVEVSSTFAESQSPVSLIILKPDGTLLSPVPDIDPDGAPTYIAILPAGSTDVAGTWTYRFVGPGGIEEGYFTVIDSAVLRGVPRYTYDLDTSVGQLRLLTDDRDLTRVGNNVRLEQRSAVWNDDELRYFLSSNGDNAYLAAGRALRALAANRNLLVQSRRINNTTVDYGNIRADLLKQAEYYESIAYGATVPAEGIAEVGYTEFNLRQIVDNSFTRGSS